MRDADVRQALHARLTREHQAAEDTLLVDEMGLCGQVRVDVATVNGSLSGFELKSARDTLKRLPTQALYYSRVLDYSTLVVADSHSPEALNFIPTWWGIIQATSDNGLTVLAEIRPAQLNPQVDPTALTQLLWRDEVLAELEERGLAHGVRSKPRKDLWARLSAELLLDDLRGVVRRKLKAREGWQSARRLSADGAG